jgi:hypothetical protein
VPQTITLTTRRPVEIPASDLAVELADRCADLLAGKSWPDRLSALMELHDQLRDDIEDFEMFCEVFPLFIGHLISRLGEEPISSQEQAHIYANSAVAVHRQAAGAWMRQHAG